MGAIELTVLCVVVFKVGYFGAQIRETRLDVQEGGWSDLLPLWKDVIDYLQGINITKSLAFLIVFLYSVFE